jgi:hypothetical protein
MNGENHMSIERNNLRVINLKGNFKFLSTTRDGYYQPKGWAIQDKLSGQFLVFNEKSDIPYTPSGGRKTAVEVAETVILDENIYWIKSTFNC